jgi:DNA invertase Pin-like site-specific DNA recombinase
MHRAIPYSRFSSGAQAQGDSSRRQSNQFRDFCRRFDLTPWEEMGVNDDGVSAWRGNNAKVGGLADFLVMVRSGQIPPGTVLVVEDQDRLSRDQILPTVRLMEELIKHGVYIGDAMSGRLIKDLNDPLTLLSVVISAQRAWEYSERLSVRKKSSWEAKRSQIDQEKLTASCPSWVRLSPDRTRWERVPENVAKVREVYRLASRGQVHDTDRDRDER